MGVINFHSFRATNPNAKGLPEMYDPSANLNGDFHSHGKGYMYQYMPSDHPRTPTFNKDGLYKHHEMLYHVNKQCFRADPFDKKLPGLMSLGCSFTFGIGLRERDIWPKMLSQKLGMPNWNLGCGGMGPDYCYYVAKQFFEEGYIPKKVAVLWPGIHRTLVTKSVQDLDEDVLDYINTDSSKVVKHTNFYCPGGGPLEGFEQEEKSILLRSETDVVRQFLNYRDSLIMLCKLHNVEYAEIIPKSQEKIIMTFIKNCKLGAKTDTFWSVRRDEWSDRTARDGLHYGTSVQKLIYEKFLGMLNV